MGIYLGGEIVCGVWVDRCYVGSIGDIWDNFYSNTLLIEKGPAGQLL